MAPHMNETLEAFNNGMFVGVKDEEENYEVVLVPKTSFDSINFSMEDEKVMMKWIVEPETSEIKKEMKNLASDKNLELWKVIENFYCSVAGDHAFFATIQGRDGSSSRLCPYCSLNINEWKRGKTAKDATTLTLDVLKKMEKKYFEWEKEAKEAKAKGLKAPPKPDTFGVCGKVQWNADPSTFTLPMLHLLIGLLNKALEDMKAWLDTHVELIGDAEMAIRRNCMAVIKEHLEVTERLDIVCSAKAIAYHTKLRLKGELKELKELNIVDSEKEEEAARNIIHLENLRREYKELVKRKKELREKEKDLTKKVKDGKKERIGDEDGLDTIINKIVLMIARIAPQAFHGGSLNGVDCRRFLDNVVEIMNAIKEESIKRLEKSIEKFGATLTVAELDEKMESFYKLYRVMDVVFATLRTPAPTSDEIKRLEDTIKVFKELWIELDISITVKAHVLFDHGLEQIKKEGGIADRGEDFIEKHHQKVTRIDHLYSSLPTQCFEQAQMAAIKRMHLNDHPVIQQQIEKVNQKSRRNFTNDERSTAAERKKEIRDQNREDTTTSQWFNEILNKLNN